jgi:hypothetical protein
MKKNKKQEVKDGDDWEMVCPKCGSKEVAVQKKVWLRDYDDSEVTNREFVFETDDPARCLDCRFEDRASAFEVSLGPTLQGVDLEENDSWRN